MTIDPKLGKKLRLSGALIALGLTVELFTWFWTNPTSFLLFLIGGCGLTAAGVLLYLFSIVSLKS